MPFYLRKSIKCGPLRFNLSKSGIGMSAGIKGVRVGSGPRGNYVQMGICGVNYRRTFTWEPSQAKPGPKSKLSGSDVNLLPADTLHEIESSDVSQLKDASAEDLLAEIRDKRRVPSLFFPVALVFTILVIGVAGAGSVSLSVVLAIIGLAASCYAAQRDRLRKTVVIFYDLDEERQAAYEVLYESFERLASCNQIWHVEAEGLVTDQKRNYGASGVVKRSSVSFKCTQPSWLSVNFDVPVFPAGNQSICLLPDTVLVLQCDDAGSVAYQDLIIVPGETRFAETASVPRDSKVVGRTWQYVNKNGGPDKRFKNNREIPIARYGDITLRSAGGLNECFQVSDPEKLNAFIEVLAQYNSKAQSDARSVKKARSYRKRDR
ncbi:MAG: DUF4236 domain-containing protein [Candidatus Obscuribacter sp.]|nr:DUF4236 domain-containing protein [Candidatus Obscuribacter sp.]